MNWNSKTKQLSLLTEESYPKAVLLADPHHISRLNTFLLSPCSNEKNQRPYDINVHGITLCTWLRFENDEASASTTGGGIDVNTSDRIFLISNYDASSSNPNCSIGVYLHPVSRRDYKIVACVGHSNLNHQNNNNVSM